jgi:glycerol kinase
MPYLLSLDAGTTSARAIVFDDAGAVRSVAQKEFPQRYPQPGWVEHDPAEIWSTQLGVAIEALGRANLRPSDIAGIGIANQRETTIVWERSSGQPIHPAIVWQDRRTADVCERLRDDGLEEFVRERTGLVIDAYFSATKIAWILDHVPGARDRAERGELAFGTVDAWLIWNLSGGAVHATDASNASRTLLYDIHRGDWDDELLAAFRVPRAMLPRVVDSSGPIATAASGYFGPAGVTIAGVAGDQQAALFGQNCYRPGQTKTTYGTGCFLLQNTGAVPTASRHRLLTTVAARMNGKMTYALEGSVFVGGALIQWLRDGLGIIARSEEIGPLAASVPDSGGVVIVPAFVGLGAPHWDSSARGLIAGITRGVTRAHIARAALEGIAFQVADLIEAVETDSGLPLPEMLVDGGAAKCDVLMQIQADLLGVPLARPAQVETTALGAAYLAGLGVGVWRDPAELASLRRIERRFQPMLNPDDLSARRARWREAVSRSRGWTS